MDSLQEFRRFIGGICHLNISMHFSAEFLQTIPTRISSMIPHSMSFRDWKKKLFQKSLQGFLT